MSGLLGLEEELAAKLVVHGAISRRLTIIRPGAAVRVYAAALAWPSENVQERTKNQEETAKIRRRASTTVGGENGTQRHPGREKKSTSSGVTGGFSRGIPPFSGLKGQRISLCG